MNHSKLRKSLVVGLRWSLISKLLLAVVGLVVPVIMARMITPDEYGIFVMASVFTGISAVFTNFGTGQAIIQHQKHDHELESSVFWLNLMVGAVVAMIFLIGAPYISSFYGNSNVMTVVSVMTVNIILNSAAVVPSAIIQRELYYRSVMIIQLASVTVGGVVAIIMAYYGWGIWSLMMQGIASSFVAFLLSLYRARFIPGVFLSLNKIKKILRFSLHLTAVKVISYIVKVGDNFIVSVVLGSSATGVYSRSHVLFFKPVKMINSTIAQVLYPVMAKVKDDNSSLAKMFSLLFKTYLMVFVPTAVFFMLYPEGIILLLLGDQWGAIVPLLPWFGAALLARSLDKSTPHIMQALNKTNILLKTTFIIAPIFIAAIYIGVQFGLIGVAIAVTGSAWFSAILRIVITSKLLRRQISDFVHDISSVFILIAIPVIILLSVRVMTEIFMSDQSIAGMLLAMTVTLVATVSCYWRFPNDVVHEFYRVVLKR